VLPLASWHVFARRFRPRPTDASRRVLVKAAALGAASIGGYAVLASVVRVAGLPGARRRFTGSYEVGSFVPERMPSYIWLNDGIPTVDPSSWRLAIVDGKGRYELTLAELSTFDTRVSATLDCTSGWYARQDWTGTPLSALLRDTRGARSLYVHSVTGYWIRLPPHDADRALLATGVGGAPLSAGHGFPLRLVVPGRRGFWWVKWVTAIDVNDEPWWWQPPFPLT
jgi:DMSO/TMAO reductase YedYZ molybdopterin-dependent catalytic subunit